MQRIDRFLQDHLGVIVITIVLLSIFIFVLMAQLGLLPEGQSIEEYRLERYQSFYSTCIEQELPHQTCHEFALENVE